MNNQEISKGPSILDRTRITLREATKRAKAWRTLLSSIPSGNTDIAGNPIPLIPAQRIFRSINVNMDDIDQLKKDHPEARSIRVYLSLPDPKYPYNICGMLVPVDQNNNDMLTTSIEGDTMTEDEILDSVSRSTIYDFTMPCPSMCDPNSQLFNVID
ncbi:hypothetical protein [Pedobacter sp. MR2016-24]|uniref:hypothetical protein n=1 Tax=Pedobacter sp. MR2016-24 TaxID=2994466 RepID=UPI002246B496|nr:hypothetical protein [Pedobacter sp. MR2016-24]MCX2486661.1 hypothetical protein [Pedobacter sp. MR2016-24]